MRRPPPQFKNRVTQRHNSVLPARRPWGGPSDRRNRGARTTKQGPFLPPEDWYEPAEGVTDAYRILEQDPGPGFRHVVTIEEIQSRLSQLPPAWLEPLEVVQLSRMTRKKRSFPCYGMQWGAAVYLYPIEQSLVEAYRRPPSPLQRKEARMYGGRWEHVGREWRLVWTLEAVRDFYVNNVLIHELGHLLDDRNSSYADRERFADWFATEVGYKPTRAAAASRPGRRVVRRHHR